MIIPGSQVQLRCPAMQLEKIYQLSCAWLKHTSCVNFAPEVQASAYIRQLQVVSHEHRYCDGSMLSANHTVFTTS